MVDDWPAKSLADSGRLIRFRKSFTMPPFLLNFFAAVDEGWSAMGEIDESGSLRDQSKASRHPSHLLCNPAYTALAT
jgi:hypothetical protein